jgi:peroxiredoxin Q/BCP
MPILSWVFEEPLAVGKKAPDFSLHDQSGNLVSLARYRDTNNVVLVFYPGDDTGLCTKQLCEFRDNWELAKAKQTIVFGVNPQNAEKHTSFIAKYQYPFSLLVDQGQRVARLYSASGLFVRRTVYLIGKSGNIRFGQRGKPSPQTVLLTAE